MQPLFFMDSTRFISPLRLLIEQKDKPGALVLCQSYPYDFRCEVFQECAVSWLLGKDLDLIRLLLDSGVNIDTPISVNDLSVQGLWKSKTSILGASIVLLSFPVFALELLALGASLSPIILGELKINNQFTPHLKNACARQVDFLQKAIKMGLIEESSEDVSKTIQFWEMSLISLNTASSKLENQEVIQKYLSQLGQIHLQNELVKVEGSSARRGRL